MAGDTHASNTNNNSDHSDRPPAFLDLADSRVELKRLEHERLRQLHRKNFEEQMRMLEAQQAAEERHLLTISAVDAHVAVSAPTTPPRLSAQLSANHDSVNGGPAFDHSALSQAVGKANKRKSVNYAPSPSIIQDSGSVYTGSLHPHSFSRNLGAKSMPASRRTSTSSQDLDELGDLTLNALTLNERAGTPTYSILRSHDSALRSEPQPIDAGLMLDNEIDKEINTAMRYVHPAVEEDKFAITRTESFPGRLSASSAALDLAPLSGTPPRSSYLGRNGEGNGPNAGKSSEWPQFSGRAQDNGVPVRPEKHRTVTTPIGLGTLSTISPVVSRRSSPPGLSDAVSMTTTRSVPATPLGQLPNGKVNVLLKPSPTSLVAPGVVSELAAHQLQDRSFTTGDLNATLSRLTGTTSGSFEGGSYAAGMQPSPEEPSQFGVDALYGGGINGSYESNRFNRNSGSFSAGFDATARGPQPTANVAGSTALYHHHGTRYGLSHGNVNPRVGGGGSGGGGSGGGGSSTSGGADNKMNGLHGPKHKRGDVDREFNRFTGTRLEDLQGEIASLCKDQHGCRYLQKKLEEGVPEHRDIIFHETFGHFADLMTDPFGNYLCQKLVEYSNDEQRNVICESVAKDLVTISLNMHGTRAVQKMIDFLSTQRQIRAIIVALGLHVVTLIKDLNGNHVIQKCLNKLAPEDNQFIYNAVAQNCVEVATHRHGCCVLQRCIDHASDSQRVQLVQEITYNALTLVQDPYGNYVVQYILDLNDNRFSDGVIRQFSGNVCALSVQKFSSNVIEKCVRVAEPHTRKLLIDELLHRNRLEKLLRDSFGNYCVQTALDYAEPQQRALLVDGIRPILPMIRNTPYGKRIQSKLQREAMDTHGGQYSGYPQILSGGFPGQPARHLAHGGIHPSSGLSDLYGSQSPLYSNGLHQAALATPQMHSSALHALPHTIDPYIMQSNGGLRQGAASTASFNGFAGNGFASTMGVGDTQYQRYHYAM